MPPTVYVPCPGVAQVEMRYLWNGGTCENVLYFQGTLGFGISAMEGLAEALRDWWAQSLRQWMVATCELREIYVTDLTTQTSPTFARPVSPALAGQLPGPSAPNSVCPVVSFRTVDRGKSGRGRNYVPGAGEEYINASVFAPAYLTGIAAAYTLLAQTGYIPDWLFSVVSRFTNNAPRAVGRDLAVQNVRITSPYVRSQRGRLPR